MDSSSSSSSSSTGVSSPLLRSSLDPAYRIEASVLEAVTALSLLVAAMLVLSSMPRWATKPVATSKRVFHCVVLVCAILNVVKSVDSQQALYRFNSDAYITIFLTNNITCCLMLGGALLIYNTIDVQHRINKSATPPALPWLLAAVSCLNFLFINVCTALAVTKLKQVYYLYILFYLISSFSVLMIIADCSVWNVRSLVLKYQDRSVSVRSKVLAAEKSLYPLYGFVIFLNLLLIAVIAALSYQANLIRTKNRYSLPPDRANPSDWSLDVFAWVHVVAIALFLWWSWVPLGVVRALLHRVGYAEHRDSDVVQPMHAHAQRDSKDVAGAGGGGAGATGSGGTGPNRMATIVTAALKAGGHSSARLSGTKGPLLVVARTSVAGVVDSSRGTNSLLRPIDATGSARSSNSHGRLYQTALLFTNRRVDRVSPALGPSLSPAPLHPGPINGTPLLGPAALTAAAAAGGSAGSPSGSSGGSIPPLHPESPPKTSSPSSQREGGATTTPTATATATATAAASPSGLCVAASNPPDLVTRNLSVGPSHSSHDSGSAVSRGGAAGAAHVSVRGRFVSKHTDDIVGEQSLSREDARSSGQNSPLLSPSAMHQLHSQLAPFAVAASRLTTPSRRDSGAPNDSLASGRRLSAAASGTSPSGAGGHGGAAAAGPIVAATITSASDDVRDRASPLLGVANIASPVARASHRNTLDTLSMPAIRDATIPIDFRK